MAENKRKPIPKSVQLDVYKEAWGRCAVPRCKESLSLEMAHMYPVSEGGDNDFMNLILLCPNCHAKFDSNAHYNKGMDGNSLLNLKKNLMVLNNRYCSFEIRLLEFFMKNPERKDIQLLEREIDVMYLIKDGLIKIDDKKGGYKIKSDCRRKSIFLQKKAKISLEDGRIYKA